VRDHLVDAENVGVLLMHVEEVDGVRASWRSNTHSSTTVILKR